MQTGSDHNVNIGYYSIFRETGDSRWMDALLSSCRVSDRSFFSHLFERRSFPFSRFSNNGKEFLASGGDDKRVLIWPSTALISSERADHRCIHSLIGHSSNIFDIVWSSRNTLIASAGNDECVLIHDLESGKREPTLKLDDEDGPVRRISLKNNDDSVLLSACEGGTLGIWDFRNGRRESAVTYEDSIFSAQFNPTNPIEYLVVGREGLLRFVSPKKYLWNSSQYYLVGCVICGDQTGKLLWSTTAITRRKGTSASANQANHSVFRSNSK